MELVKSRVRRFISKLPGCAARAAKASEHDAARQRNIVVMGFQSRAFIANGFTRGIQDYFIELAEHAGTPTAQADVHVSNRADYLSP
jgi:hypothetical protein